MPTLAVAGLGTLQASYDPPISQTLDTVSAHTNVVFTPAVPCSDAPLRLLVSARWDGTIEAECTGAITSVNLSGTLRWSDDTTSAFGINSATAAAFVQGHGVGHAPGTITSGYYEGSRIDLLALAFTGDVAACLSGRTVSASSGAAVITVTTP